MWRKNITKRIEISGMTLQGTGMYLLPTIHVSICYRMPMVIFLWWSFRLTLSFMYEIPRWFMKVWSLTVNFEK